MREKDHIDGGVELMARNRVLGGGAKERHGLVACSVCSLCSSRRARHPSQGFVQLTSRHQLPHSRLRTQQGSFLSSVLLCVCAPDKAQFYPVSHSKYMGPTVWGCVEGRQYGGPTVRGLC